MVQIKQILIISSLIPNIDEDRRSCVCVCWVRGGVNASLGSIPGDIKLILLVIYQLNLEKKSSGEKISNKSIRENHRHMNLLILLVILSKINCKITLGACGENRFQRRRSIPRTLRL